MPCYQSLAGCIGGIAIRTTFEKTRSHNPNHNPNHHPYPSPNPPRASSFPLTSLTPTPQEATEPDGITPPRMTRSGEKSHVKVDALGQAPRGAYYDIDTTRHGKELSGLLSGWHRSGNGTKSHLTQAATKNVSFVPAVLSKRATVLRAEIVRFVADGVFIQESNENEGDDAAGPRFIPLDDVVFCNGYSPSFPFIDDPAYRPSDFRTLFMHSFMPLPASESQSDLRDSTNSNSKEKSGGMAHLSVDSAPLAFIGFARPTTGANPAVSELIACLFALVVSKQHGNTGMVPIPSSAELIL